MLGVTPCEVCVFELVFGGYLVRDVARLSRADVRVRPVQARTDRSDHLPWSAVLLCDGLGRDLLEVRVAREDDPSADLLVELLSLTAANGY